MYNVNVVDNNIVYSLDMIRLKTYVTYAEYSELEFYFNTVHKDKIKKFWISDRPMCFKYNYSIEIEEGKSFYFAFMHNNEGISYGRDDIKYNLTIEFNPNKLKDNPFVMRILNMSGEWFIKSYDMAFDLKINILDLIYDKACKRSVKIENYGYDNKTIWIGSGDGRIKIYNKKKESKLNILNDLTRVEISRCVNDFEVRKVQILKYDNLFPEVYTNDYMFSFSDYEDKTLLAILYAVQNGYPIRDLTKTYKRKLKGLLEGGYKIRFSNKVATEVLRRTIFFYFINNNKVHWY